MDLLDETVMSKLDKEDEKNRHFEDSSQILRLISTAEKDTSLDYLLKVKHLFQRMLPKMPREYISRQVFGPKHCCLVLSERDERGDFVSLDSSCINGSDEYSSSERIIGAVCYQPAFERNIVEIVFFAVSSECHISGYGTFLFNCLKEACKLQFSEWLCDSCSFVMRNRVFSDLGVFSDDNPSRRPLYVTDDYSSDKNLYLLTYADNSAIGFFKKQGFSLRPVSLQWSGYIKDYDGGTLMECKVLRDIQYFRKKSLVQKIRKLVFKQMEGVNQYHVVRSPEKKEELEYLAQQYRDSLRERTREGFLNDFLFFLLCRLQSDPSSWPFLEPVNTEEVPDYLSVISRPIDLGTIFKKYRNGVYKTLSDFSDDMYLMVNNCFTYNAKETQYYKCGEAIQDLYDSLISKYASAIKKWGFEKKARV